MRCLSVVEHLSGQLVRLCEVVGTDPAVPVDLLTDLLGCHGSRPLCEPPAWPSNIADDHTPVEFSLAYNQGEPPALRILGEALGSPAGAQTNMRATHKFIGAVAERFGLSESRLDSVRDLFATEHLRGEFALWCSLVFRSRRKPELKVYLNPELKGVERAPDLVGEALHRLRLGKSYQMMLEHAIRPGELGRKDRLTFFALDLDDGPQARIKLYLTHHDAEARDAVRAAGMVDGVDAAELAEFCAVAGGTDHFDRRPLVSSYTLVEGADTPIGYSIYVPIRGYVTDDQEARDRVVALLDRYGFDSGVFDRAVTAVTQRSLRDGVGLMAHVSMRLGPPRPGVTVYLSAEAYQVSPPRQLQAAAARQPGEPPAARTAAATR